jgi:hypothetical protein
MRGHSKLGVALVSKPKGRGTMSRSDLNPALKRRIRRLEESTGRTCRKIGVRVLPKGEKYIFGAFVNGRHDRAVFTIGYWEQGIQRFIPAT